METTMTREEIRRLALGVAINHHLSVYSGTDPLEVFEGMADDNVVIWEPFQYYPLEDIEVFISSLADDIEIAITKALEKE